MNEGLLVDIARRADKAKNQRAQAVSQTKAETQSLAVEFIEPVAIETAQTSAVAWTSFNAREHIPSGAKVVLLEHEYNISSPDAGADLDSHVYERTSDEGHSYLICRGRASGSGDNIASAGQGMFPIDEKTQTFEYCIEAPGFSGGLSLRLIGYLK